MGEAHINGRERNVSHFSHRCNLKGLQSLKLWRSLPTTNCYNVFLSLNWKETISCLIQKAWKEVRATFARLSKQDQHSHAPPRCYHDFKGLIFLVAEVHVGRKRTLFCNDKWRFGVPQKRLATHSNYQLVLAVLFIEWLMSLAEQSEISVIFADPEKFLVSTVEPAKKPS